MILNSKRVCLLAVFAAALSAQAHPGHASLSLGVGHFSGSLYHLAVACLLAVGFWFLASFLNARRPRMFLRGAGVAIGVLAFWGLVA